MHLPGLLSSPPSLRDVERAVVAELRRCASRAGGPPTAWSVRLADRDLRRRARDLADWRVELGARLLEEHRRLGVAVAGPMTVSFTTDGELAPGLFQVLAEDDPAVHRGQPTGPDQGSAPGRPRLTVTAGGTADAGSPAARGVETLVPLQLGTLVIGRGRDADLRLADRFLSPRHAAIQVATTTARLRDLGSRNGTLVDGVPVAGVDLVDGNRIELGHTTLVFHRDAWS